MAISFTPAIDDAISIALADWQAAAGTVELRFSARLGDEERQQFRKEGIKVQLWTDIPSGNRIVGEWGAIDLHEPPTIGSSETQISLARAQDFESAVENQHYNVLSVICSVPISRNSTNHYSFTYRLVYPSGEIKWLGNFGRDGRLRINSSASKDDSSIVLEKSWTEGIAPFVWNSCGRQVENMSVAQISQPQLWNIWSVNENSISGHSADDASLLFLVPRIEPNTILLPKTVIFSASPEISINYDSAGKICVSGSGSLLLHTYDALENIDAFFGKVQAHSSSLGCRLFGFSGNHIGLALPQTSSSVQALVVPLVPSGNASQILLPTHSLASVSGVKTPQYTIYTPLRPGANFVDCATSEPEFVVPPSGGVFVLSPLYPIPKNLGSDTAGALFVTVTSPHLLLEDAVKEAHVLPTPPPSPDFPATVHSPPSVPLKMSAISVSDEEDLVPQIDDERSAPDSEASSSPAPPSPAIAPVTRQSSFVSLVESYSENMPTIFKYFYLFFMFWFSLTFGKLLGLSTDANRQSKKRTPLTETLGNEEEVAPGEDTSLLDPEVLSVTPVSSVFGVGSPESRVIQTPSPVTVSAVSSGPVVPSVAFTLFKARPGQKHGLILPAVDAALGAENISEKVAITINAIEIPLAHVKILQNGALYLDLDRDEPGHMVVKLL